MKFNEDEQLDMYVAPQDYILDAVKDPENLEFETDIIGEIPELDTVEPTIFNKFTIQASPVEQAVFTDEPDAINESHCTGDMLEALVPVEEPIKPATKKNDSRFYIVQLLGRDGKWKTICKSLDAEYAYQIYDRWNDRIESGDTEFATDISFSDPQELMYEAMEVTELEFCKKAEKNEGFISPAEEQQIVQCFIKCDKDINKTIDTLKLAATRFSEDEIHNACAYAYVDLASEDWFDKHRDWEDDMPMDAYNKILKDAEAILGGKLREDYYVESKKNERGGSDYGSFYNMLADKLQEEGFEGLKKIAWYCDLGMEFSGIANAIHEFRDEDFKSINKRAFKIFSAIDSMVADYADQIYGAAEYFNSLGKQDNRFDNMVTDMLEDYSLGTPNIGVPNNVIDFVDDIVAELPKSIDLSNKGLNALYRIIDSITAPQGAMGTKKAIKVQLKAALDKEIAKANRIVALLKQEWPEGIQPQRDMFKGPEDINKLEYEIHAILGKEMYSNTLSDDFGSFFIADANDSANGICVNFYFGQPEGSVRVKAYANPEQYGDDYTREAVYKLPTDVNELAQNAISLHEDAMELMQNSLDEE